METNEEDARTLDAVAASFRDARGDDDDAQWARLAAARLALDDVRASLARQALAELVPVVAQSQEPACELFGDPVEWATARQEAWREEGKPVSGPAEPPSPQAFVHDLLFGAAVVAVVMTPLRMLVDGWVYDLNVALLLFPGLMSAGFLGLPMAWRAVGRRRSRVVALVCAAGLLVAYGALLVGVFALTYPVSFGEVAGWWMFAVATGYGLLASAVGRLWPAPSAPGADQTPGADPLPDAAWVRHLAVDLRRRGDFTEARVRTVVDEAVAHAADTGGSLQEEFGAPQAYAARFAPDVVQRRRRTAWSWSLLACAPVAMLAMYVAKDGWGWQNQYLGAIVWFGAAAFMATTSWRRLRSAVTGAGAAR